ncbi:MAG: hypothetical protein KDD67_16175 [Ignavibacteriae bacterium]|nr:hypothetical protein [Ignavibacteriota bacterium]MCB9216835.1 hypothetical protein [Ignavibacteria bacterium]
MARISTLLSPILFLLFILLLGEVQAQPVSDPSGSVAIGGVLPDPAAMLDLQSAKKGFLMPRMTSVQRDGVANPPEGLMIYNTDLGVVQTWSDASGVWQWDTFITTGSNLGWLTIGNGGLVDGTDNYLGTLDAVPLRMVVNSTERLVLNTNGSIQRDAGGSGRGVEAVDIQVSRANVTEVASGDYSVIGGGVNNTASSLSATVGGGRENRAANSYSVVSGGRTNEATGFYSVVGGGQSNEATNFYSAAGGGQNNKATGFYSVVGGGQNNQATNFYSVVGGGQSNKAIGSYAVISGGQSNQATGFRGFVGGGGVNFASGALAAVAGGEDNGASGDNAFVGGGYSNRASNLASVTAGGGENVASGEYAAVLGGEINIASGTHSFVGGGRLNTAAGDYSAISGGYGLTLDAATDGSFGFLGGNSGANGMTISTPDIAVFGNVDMWLANNNGTGSQLRFFEPDATPGSGAFPNGSHYTSFEARTQSADINYLLPDVPGGVGDILAIDAIAGTQISLDWTSDATLSSLRLNGATAVTNSRIVVNGGHWTSQGAAPNALGDGTNLATYVMVATASTDVAGRIIATDGGGIGTGVIIVTFNAAYATDPIVVVTPANMMAAGSTYFVSNTTTTSFEINISTTTGNGADTYLFNYHVIEID